MNEADENNFCQYEDNDFEDEEWREILALGEEIYETADSEPANGGLVVDNMME